MGEGRDEGMLNQTRLRGVGFRLGFLEIQVRLVVGMLGAVRAGKQAFNRQPLHAQIFLACRAGVKAGGRGIVALFSQTTKSIG